MRRAVSRLVWLSFGFRPFVFFLALLIAAVPAQTQEDEDCMMCHAAEEGVDDADAGLPVVRIAESGQSIHFDMGFSCTDCHVDIEEVPHESELEPVNCAGCHDDAFETFSHSVHGQAVLERHDQFAPTCASCHGIHTVKPSSNPTSKTNIMNIPATCGTCHKEGTEMTATHEIDQKNVVSNYSMSIHGEGLFRRGLKVTAVCTSCHGSHDILPHQHPDSKINKENVVGTCMNCHAQIEQVHEKIIEGQLWEKEPHKIPVCVDCHAPHKIQRVFYDIEIADGTCMACHSDPNLKMEKDGERISLFVDIEEHKSSVHANTACVKCHYDVHPDKDPVCKDIAPVDCAVCHADEVGNYQQGIHGKLFAEGDPDAPDCSFCHGTHGILTQENQTSPTFPRNVPGLCSQCHADNQPAALAGHANQEHIIANYTMSIHGKGLMESGLVVTAMCTDCHTTHNQLPANDPESSVNQSNVGKTCGTCHLGIYEEFRTSIHSAEVNDTEEELPGCSDCHQSHTIMRVDQSDFRTQIISQCGRCHEELTETYFDTYHGKVSKLGESGAAKCFDCHGSHNIFPISDPRSTLHRNHIIDTCKNCHPGSNRKFTGYLTHATHHDRVRYPALYYSFWFMTLLLVGTLAFFGLHTLLWLIRSLIVHAKERDERAEREKLHAETQLYFRRFRILHRGLHFLVIVSFMSLALTGMILKFPDVALFAFLSKVLGGPAVMGVIHRIGAIITFTYFGIHLIMLLRLLKKKEITLENMFSSEHTMLPTLRDLSEFKQNILWFLGVGERPHFGRWTYWEKFDYFAVFWGVFIIGSTGLILWFPEIATIILPGWFINVATVIHSDEALLAAGFIFTIHFFNTHFRPEVFPMDPVIFTGRIPLEEFKRERAREYQQLVESGELDKYIVGPPPHWLVLGARIVGFTFLAIGLILIGTILYGMLFIYM